MNLVLTNHQVLRTEEDMNSENSQPTGEAESMQPERLADASLGEESQQTVIESEAIESGTSLKNEPNPQRDCFATFTQCPTGVHHNPPTCTHRVNCLTRAVLV